VGIFVDYISRIKQVKSEKKITNEKLSELTGIPLSTVSKILAGISDSPKLSNMVLIARALGCTLDYIVSGTPENNNNYTLNDKEIEFIEIYRQLDFYGKDLVETVAQKELDRLGVISESTAAVQTPALAAEPQKSAKILSIPHTSSVDYSYDFAKKSILLYDLPVSAGPGVYLDDELAEPISIPMNDKTESVSFALRISGNSMEPKYHDGDIVLVENAESVNVGELGIFILDGNGYFKKYGGDRLISLNEEYGDILLRDYVESVCCGRVVGKLKRK
jgi:SOS-response transcriptional repressor LexA/DNA-binding Xre family transcriptional regulator